MRLWCGGLLVAALMMFASGCNKGSNSGTTRGGPNAGTNRTTGHPNNNTFDLHPSNVTVTQGQTAKLDIGIKRHQFGDAVKLTITPKVADVTMGNAEGTAEAGANADDVSIEVTAGANAAVGDHDMTVKGEGANGGKPAESHFTLTVKAGHGGGNPPAGASFDINAPNFTLKQGESKDYTVGIKRAAGSTEAVTVSFDKLPTGVTVTPTKKTAEASDANVTFKMSAAANTSTGTAKCEVVGSPATGSAVKQSFDFTVKKK
jgi:hypothetical protein